MSSSKFSLIVRLPGKKLDRHDLEGESVSIGRGPDNDIQILVAEVSVEHAELSCSGESVHLRDKDSTNGTAVNAARVGKDGAELKPMSKIVFGATIETYFVPSAVLESTPAEELVESIDANASGAKPKTGTAPVAAAAPQKPSGTAPGAPAAPKPGGGASPKPVPPASQPAASQADAGAQTVKLNETKTPPRPGGGPAQPPAAPGGAKPPAPGGAKPPSAPKPPAPGGDKPGGPPKPPSPVPLRRPAPAGGGGTPEPQPPKPGGS